MIDNIYDQWIVIQLYKQFRNWVDAYVWIRIFPVLAESFFFSQILSISMAHFERNICMPLPGDIAKSSTTQYGWHWNLLLSFGNFSLVNISPYFLEMTIHKIIIQIFLTLNILSYIKRYLLWVLSLCVATNWVWPFCASSDKNNAKSTFCRKIIKSQEICYILGTITYTRFFWELVEWARKCPQWHSIFTLNQPYVLQIESKSINVSLVTWQTYRWSSFLGPLDLLPWCVVGRSVGLSVNTCNSATNVRIFFKIGGNIPWVNITRRFFRFCKIFNFEFKKKIISIFKNLKVHFLKICQITFFLF